MEYDIRPLSFGEILDRSFRVLIDNAVVLISITAVVFVPYRLMISGGKVMISIGALLLMVAVPLLHAAMIYATADRYLGQSAGVEQSYRLGWSIFWPFVGTILLLYLVLFAVVGVPLFLFFVVLARSIAISTRATFLISLGVGLIGGFYVGVRWSLIGAVMVVERRFGRAALKRGFELTAHVFWRTFGILFVAGLIVQVPTAALGLIWSSIPILGAVLSGLTMAVGSAYSNVVLVLYYFDRRCRIEDFDLKRLAEQVRAESAHFGPATPGVPNLG